MVFSDAVFLYAFFPIVFIIYYICRKIQIKNAVLLVASLVFYSWGEPKYVVLMIGVSLIAYIGGLLLEKYKTNNKKRKIVFVGTVVILVLNLVVFKYLNFFCNNIEALFRVKIPLREIALPIGISFYTFQIMSYIIDLYKGEIAVQRNFFYLTLYVSFFPQLIAGPIVRYQTVEDEIRNRTTSLDDISYGMKRFVKGLAKKVIIANNVALVAEAVYNSDIQNIYGTSAYWVAAIAYALQIYFDFSGYSDMASGLGRIFGFHFLENFNYPYISKSITEFWRRWHISLSTWFRDYVYIPLGGNRVSKPRWLFNIFVVWCLTGFWHGAEWNFIIWGLYYCALLLIEKLFLMKWLEKCPSVIRWLYAMILVCIGWVIFNLEDFSQIIYAVKMMFLYQSTSWKEVFISDSTFGYALIYMPLGIICSFPWFKKRVQTEKPDGTGIVSCVGYLLLFLVCIVYIISSSYNPFIYFRF